MTVQLDPFQVPPARLSSHPASVNFSMPHNSSCHLGQAKNGCRKCGTFFMCIYTVRHTEIRRLGSAFSANSTYLGAKTAQKLENPKFQTPNSKIQNPNSRLQNPNLKHQIPKSEFQTPNSKIQNPNSRLQNPNLKHQIPKSEFQTPNSKIQNRNSKLQNPNSTFENSKFQHPKSNFKIKIPNNSTLQNPKIGILDGRIFMMLAQGCADSCSADSSF